MRNPTMNNSNNIVYSSSCLFRVTLTSAGESFILLASPSLDRAWIYCNLDLAWAQLGSDLDPAWIWAGFGLDPIWIQLGSSWTHRVSSLDPTRIHVGPSLDPAWIQLGSRLDLALIQIGSSLGLQHVTLLCQRSPSGAQAHRIPIC